MQRKRVNRRYDEPAFEAIAKQLSMKDIIAIELPSKHDAKELRMQFYLWRKQCQEVNEDPSFMSNVSTSIDEGTIIFSHGMRNNPLRQALQALNIPIEEDN
ncbi:MAG TPA: hypothetical protein VF077_00500 [Nitrospiraceae bacterium]